MHTDLMSPSRFGGDCKKACLSIIQKYLIFCYRFPCMPAHILSCSPESKVTSTPPNRQFNPPLYFFRCSIDKRIVLLYHGPLLKLLLKDFKRFLVLCK